MGFQCPNCGGNVLFDIPSQKMKCENCGSVFDVARFQVKDTKEMAPDQPEQYQEESDDSQPAGTAGDHAQDSIRKSFHRYICRNCGAQIESLDTDLVAYCQYCGGEVVLAQPGAVHMVPDTIIPFSISRQQCINRYKKFIGSCHFLPDEYKDPDFLKKFTGIYIPEWTYEAHYQGSVPFTFEDTRQISYDYGEVIRGHGEVSVSGRVEESKDASSRLDDAISDTIQPAKVEGSQPFLPGYMAGFYADVPDVAASTYKDLAAAHANQLVRERVYQTAEQKCKGTANVSLDTAALPAPRMQVKSSLQPVWFLTWRSSDRVAYSVMNGKTGSCYADMPVSIKAFIRSSLILAAVFAVILLLITHFVLLTPDVLLYLSIFLSVISADLYCSQIRDIACRENHVYDMGYQGSVRMKQSRIERVRSHAGTGSGFGKTAGFFVLFLVAIVPVYNAAATHVTDRSALTMGTLVYGIVMLVQAVRIASWARDTSRPVFGIGGFLLFLLPISGLLLFAGSVQNDLPFYLLSMAALVLLILQILLLVNYYNMLSTRPIPGFHTGRQGGTDAEN